MLDLIFIFGSTIFKRLDTERAFNLVQAVVLAPPPPPPGTRRCGRFWTKNLVKVATQVLKLLITFHPYNT